MANSISRDSSITSTTSFKRTNASIFLSPSSPQEVLNVIKALKENKARRTLDKETKFLKIANPVISNYLSFIFNSCFSSGIYPDSLKLAEVIPIFKKGDRVKTTNYRPISLLSQLNKVFEKLLYVCIYSYLIIFKLLIDNQFGFWKNSSTTLAMNKIYDEILNNIDQGLYTRCIFLDLSKVFDTVDHNVLLQKLEKKLRDKRKCVWTNRELLT